MNNETSSDKVKLRGKVSTSDEVLTFRGNFTHTIDQKGRVSVPADFRRVLQDGEQDRVVITNFISDGSRCLEGFALSSWCAFESRLREKSRFNARIQKLENFYLSRATECQIDKSGRILLPEYLRSYASIQKEVTFTASIHGFRVWDKRVWDLIFAAAENDLIDDPDLFNELDI